MAPDLGIRHNYPHIPLGERLRAYIQLARPFTLIAPLVGVFAALGMLVQYGHADWPTITSDWRVLAHAATTLLLVQVASNYVNQATDTLEDGKNRPWRPIPAGIVQKDEAMTIGQVLWLWAAARAATVNPTFGGLTLLIILASYLYSVPPVRLKARLHAGQVVVAIARGLLGLLAAWSLYAPITAPQPWTAGGVLTLFLLGGVVTKDFLDVAGDDQAGVRTWVVQYGSNGARFLVLPFALSPLFTLLAAQRLGLEINRGFLVASMASVVMLGYRLLPGNDRPNRVLEATKSWFWMYTSLALMMLSFGANGLLKIVNG